MATNTPRSPCCTLKNGNVPLEGRPPTGASATCCPGFNSRSTGTKLRSLQSSPLIWSSTTLCFAEALSNASSACTFSSIGASPAPLFSKRRTHSTAGKSLKAVAEALTFRPVAGSVHLVECTERSAVSWLAASRVQEPRKASDALPAGTEGPGRGKPAGGWDGRALPNVSSAQCAVAVVREAAALQRLKHRRTVAVSTEMA